MLVSAYMVLAFFLSKCYGFQAKICQLCAGDDLPISVPSSFSNIVITV